MNISLTLFKNIFDNKTDKRIDAPSFDAFEKVLYDLSEKPFQSKADAMLMSPATYEKNTTRKNDNVIEWAGWCCVDVDDYEQQGELEIDLVKRFSAYRFVCYSTASSTRDRPKFRLVFPLTRTVANNEIKSSGTHYKQNSVTLEISKLKTCLECIIFLAGMLMLSILFLAIGAVTTLILLN